MARRTRTTQAQSAPHPQPQSIPRNAKQVDPTGRVDIALQRFLELAATMHPDPRVGGVYQMYQQNVNRMLQQVVGPNTQVGQVARGAVSTILFINKRLEELQRHQAAHPQPPSEDTAA